jgi:hypothetical protein
MGFELRKTLFSSAVKSVYEELRKRMLSRIRSFAPVPKSFYGHNDTMFSIFWSLYLWFLTLSSLIMLAPALPLTTPSQIITPNSTAEIAALFTHNPDLTILEKRQKDFLGRCPRKNVGMHNCELMLKACYMLYEQFPENDPQMRNVHYKRRCKAKVTRQTEGDCWPNAGTWDCK